MEYPPPKIGILIQARMGSSRLPNKVMLPLAGRPVLWHVIERCRRSKLVSNIIIATSKNKENDIIELFCKENNVPFFRGSELDVTERSYHAAKIYGLDIIIRITSDCPLIDPEVLDACLVKFQEGKFDYLSNTGRQRSFPRGLDVEIFSFNALEKAYNLNDDKVLRTHVTPFMYIHDEIFRVGYLTSEGELDRAEIRLVLDTKEDYELLALIYNALYKPGEIISVQEIIKFMDSHPETHKINEKSEIEHLKRADNDGLQQKFRKIKTLIVGVGRGGHCYYDILRRNLKIEVVGFIDDNPFLKGTTYCDLPVFGDFSVISELKRQGISGIHIGIAVGSIRKHYSQKAKSLGFKLVNAIHPSAIIEDSAEIGEGVEIRAGAIVEGKTKIGDNVILDTGVHVNHDNIIERECHLAPGCVTGGLVKIGKNSLIGVGTSIASSIEIGENVVIAPGSVVVTNIPSCSVAQGNPAKIIGTRTENQYDVKPRNL